jgi:hypothetical protein
MDMNNEINNNEQHTKKGREIKKMCRAISENWVDCWEFNSSDLINVLLWMAMANFCVVGGVNYE